MSVKSNKGEEKESKYNYTSLLYIPLKNEFEICAHIRLLLSRCFLVR